MTEQTLVREYLWLVTMSTGQCGTDGVEVVSFPALAESPELSAIFWDMAKDNAESYGIYPESEYEEEAEDEDSDMDLSDNIEGYGVLYKPNEHDSSRAGGGTFLDEFKEPMYCEENAAWYVMHYNS